MLPRVFLRLGRCISKSLLTWNSCPWTSGSNVALLISVSLRGSTLEISVPVERAPLPFLLFTISERLLYTDAMWAWWCRSLHRYTIWGSLFVGPSAQCVPSTWGSSQTHSKWQRYGFSNVLDTECARGLIDSVRNVSFVMVKRDLVFCAYWVCTPLHGQFIFDYAVPSVQNFSPLNLVLKQTNREFWKLANVCVIT